MDFALTEEQQRIAAAIRDFGEREIRPHADGWERAGTFPQEAVRRLGALGWLGLGLPEDVGGSGADALSAALVVEGIARYSASLGLTVASHAGLASGHLSRFGSDALRRRYLPRMATGEWIGAWCLTEAGSGSDAAALRTRAVRDADGWLLSGGKMFITNGTVAHVYVVFASTAPDAGKRGISTFVVDRGSPGLRTGRGIEKLGLHASDTAEVIFEDVRLPPDRLVGDENQGFPQALQMLNGGRVGIAAWCLGIGRGALEESAAYIRARTSLRPSSPTECRMHALLAEMAVRLDAARVLFYRAAHLKEAGRPYRAAASMAKLTASEAAMWVTSRAVELQSRSGITRDGVVDRYLRDAKLGEIGEGTSEVQRILIARTLLAQGVATP